VVDAGEFLQLAAAAIFAPEFGMFDIVEDMVYWFASASHPPEVDAPQAAEHLIDPSHPAKDFQLASPHPVEDSKAASYPVEDSQAASSHPPKEWTAASHPPGNCTAGSPHPADDSQAASHSDEDLKAALDPVEDSKAVPHSVDDYGAAGLLLGLACMLKIRLSVALPLCLYRRLLGRPFAFDDLGEVAPQVANSIRQLVEYRAAGEDVADACLTFAADVPLCEDGDTILVVNENLETYAEACVHHYLYGRFAAQIDAFVAGFRRCFAPAELEALEPEALALMVRGEREYDWEAFEKAVVYRECDINTPCVQWFWEVFRELSEDEKREFLQYMTGNEGVPIGGLGRSRITIWVTESAPELPQAVVCFHTLRLAGYRSKEELGAKLKKSLENGRFSPGLNLHFI
jgi:hypothetical protein